MDNNNFFGQQDLSGEWNFSLDPDGNGIDENWFTSNLPDHITLPGTTDEAQKSAAGPEREGVLTRTHEYIGTAWYQREITIPESWQDRNISLYLERVLWQSQVWIDGILQGSAQDSFATPHIHQLGKLSPGKHLLSLCIDNRQIHKLGFLSHSYGHQTQTVWNGIIGQIELHANPANYIHNARIFTKWTGEQWHLELDLFIKCAEHQLSFILDIAIEDGDGNIITSDSRNVSDSAEKMAIQLSIPSSITPWAEFNPALYNVVLDLKHGDEVVSTHRERFGFRDIQHDGNQLRINGNSIFLRGNLDNVHFPLTGYPSTQKEDWHRIFHIYKEHNLNHVRFHSWCPPKAAFEAADELGLYIQAEAGIWINERQDQGEGLGPGKGDPEVDPFIQAEMRRIVDTFGNHPSFVLMAIGNELGHSNFEVTGEWIHELKNYDPRRLYAASTARTITPFCDFNATHNVPGLGSVRTNLVNHTDWDYEQLYKQTEVPIIAHEIGQWPVYPDWQSCEKYTGVLRNTRLESLREQASCAGVFSQQKQFTQASGAVNAMLYKDEIESFLRTPSCRGFQLLSMQDFQGQGEAYIGWLDTFWDSKGILDPAVFRGYCAPITVMARLPKYTYCNDENLHFHIVIRNDGPEIFSTQELTISLYNEHNDCVNRQTVTPPAIHQGSVAEVGQVDIALAELNVTYAERMTLELKLAEKEEANTYPVWVYPANLPEIDASEVLETDCLDQAALDFLQNGGTVFLDAHSLGDPDYQPKLASWQPLYWSSVLFPNNDCTLGLLLQENHSAFNHFPTEFFNNWQWWDICENAHGFELTDYVSANYQPIAQPVPDFHQNRKIGTIFELSVGRGKLLVSGYDLSPKRREKSLAVRQLHFSLLKYITSEHFKPDCHITVQHLVDLFPANNKQENLTPDGFDNAAFYLEAAANLDTQNRMVPYNRELDQIVISNNITYSLLNSAGMFRNAEYSAWVIEHDTSRLTLQLPVSSYGYLHVQLADNTTPWQGRIIVEEGRAKTNVSSEDSDYLYKIEVFREDTLDGKLTVDFTPLHDTRLLITKLIFVPGK